MKTLLMVASMFTLSIASAVHAQQLQLPPVTRETLPNGIRLVLMEYHRAPTLDVLALFPGGDSSDDPKKAGTADLMAELLRKGTAKRTAPQIAEEIDFLGGDLETASDDDKLSVTLSVLAKDADAGLDLFTDAIRRSTFSPEELERERQHRIADLQAIGEDPGTVATRVISETVFANHPYCLEATQTSLKATGRADVVSSYHRVIQPNGMILVAVGDFQSAAMSAKLKALFADWPKGDASPVTVQPLHPQPKKTILIDKPDATQTQVRWGRVAYPRNSPDYYVGEVADAMLGGGFSSRLIDEIRVNRSLTYSIGSGFYPEQRGGEFLVSSFTKIETTRALIDETNKVLQKTATDGFREDELKRMKGYLAGDFAIRMQTPDALARSLGSIAFFGLPEDSLQTYLQKINVVTLEDVNRIAKTYYSPDALSLVLVAPAAKITDTIKTLGTVETRPVASIGK